MQAYFILTSFLVLLPTLASTGDVICSLEDYVMTGIEFAKCQATTLTSFQGSNNGNPCPEIKEIVTNCALIVKRCFNDRGWERGRMVFLELLSLQYPDQNQCGVFNQKDDSKIIQKLPDEKCSIVDEVSLLTQMRICNNQAQTAAVNHINHHRAVVGEMQKSPDAIDYFVYPVLCKGLKNVSDSCFKPHLSTCYDNHDAHFHYIYMLEELKMAGTMLATHLLSSNTGVDVLNCPVFKDQSPFGANDRQTVLALALVSSFLLVAIVFSVGTFATFKMRLVPRFRAWLQNEPYEDIVIAESDRANEMIATVRTTTIPEQGNAQARDAAQEQLPSIRELEQRKKNNQTTTLASFAALRDQQEENGGQST